MHTRLVIAPLSPEARKLYDAICARGYTSHDHDGIADLRDAAHEAHHALYCGLKGPWDRERIHTALVKRASRLRRLGNGELVRFELDARAVEWNVCERFGIDYDVTRWADITWFETLKNLRIQLPEVKWIVQAITARKDTVKKFVGAVLAIADAAPPRRKKAA